MKLKQKINKKIQGFNKCIEMQLYLGTNMQMTKFIQKTAKVLMMRMYFIMQPDSRLEYISLWS